MEIFDKKRFIEESKRRNVYDENANFLNEKPIDSFLYSLVMSYGSKNPRERYIRFVKDVTEQESCIIIGRCANIIYKDDPDCVSVYLHADPDIRKKRIQERDHVSEKEAAETLREVDEKRSAFQEQCTATRQATVTSMTFVLIQGKSVSRKLNDLILQYIEYRK